jgi:bifunctional polynucleotide phosphatase/kinase
MNLKIPFFTPEEYFLGDPPTTYILGAFNPLDYIPTPVLPSTETTTSITTTTLTNTIPPTVPVISSPPAPDIILFVGSPAAGKSTFFRDHLLPMGYTRINQDTLKTRDRCVAEASTLLSQNIPIVIGLHSLKLSDK